MIITEHNNKSMHPSEREIEREKKHNNNNTKKTIYQYTGTKMIITT